MEKLENINEFLKGIPDFERTATRIALGSVKPRELAALRDALPSLNVIAENLSDLDSELLKETAEELPLPEELYQLLCASLKKSPVPLFATEMSSRKALMLNSTNSALLRITAVNS